MQSVDGREADVKTNDKTKIHRICGRDLPELAMELVVCQSGRTLRDLRRMG